MDTSASRIFHRPIFLFLHISQWTHPLFVLPFPHCIRLVFLAERLISPTSMNCMTRMNSNARLVRIYIMYTVPVESNLQVPRLHIPSRYTHVRQNRQISISPSTSSRTPSPTPLPLSPSCPSTSGGQSTKIRLVPTTFEHADAVVLVPPPDAPHMHPVFGITNPKPAQPLLLVGPALQRLRHPQRQIAKGTRFHPYRIVRSPADRRFSIASATAN